MKIADICKIAILCMVVAFISACEREAQSVSYDDGAMKMGVIVPKDIVAAAINGLQATAQIDSGPIIPLTVNSDDTVVGTIPNVSFGTHELKLHYFTVYGSNSESITLAAMSKQLDVVEGAQNEFSITANELNRVHDFDGDTYSNIDELKQGTDPTQAGSYIASIAITQSTSTIALGEDRQFAATATYPDLTTGDISTMATWASSMDTVATVDSTGLVHAASVGTTNISAELGGQSASVNVTVSDAVLSTIRVTPVDPTVNSGNTIQFTATGVYSDSTEENLSALVTWKSLNNSVALINASGLATTSSEGSAVIEATYLGVTGTTTLNVGAAVLESVVVTPADVSIPLGISQSFTATANYSDGSSTNITANALTSWSLSPANTSVASINSFGQLQTLAQGAVTVNALFNNVLGSTSFTVTAPELVSISISPPANSVALGLTYNVTVTGTYTDNSTNNVTSQVTWTTPNNISVSSAGIVNGTAVGTYTLTANLQGRQATAQATITSKELLSIAVSSADPIVSLGERTVFSAVGTYTDDSTANITATATWSSSNTNVASVSNIGEVRNKVAGTSNIQASQAGVTGSALYTASGDRIVNRTYILAQTGELLVVDSLDNSVIDRITLPANTNSGLALYPRTLPLWAYISNYTDDLLVRVDLRSHTVGNPIAVGNGPQKVLVFSDTRNPKQFPDRIYTLNINPGTGSANGTMTVVNPASDTVVKTVTGLGESPRDGGINHLIPIITIANQAFPFAGRNGSVMKYNDSTGALTTIAPEITCPRDVEYRQRTGRIIITNDCSNGASTTSTAQYYNVLSGTTDFVEGPVSLGSGGSVTALAVNRQGLETFVMRRSNIVNVTEYVFDAIVGQLNMTWGTEMQFNDVTNKLYAPTWFQDPNEVRIFQVNGVGTDTVTVNQIGSIPNTSVYKHGIAFTPIVQ